jgi:hypothetical protein
MLVITSNLDQRSDFRTQEMKTMLKLISLKTIGTTAVSLALLAGTLATPAFAKSQMGWIKPAIANNRGFSMTRGFERHFGGFKVVGVKETLVRYGLGHVDTLTVYNKTTHVSGN